MKLRSKFFLVLVGLPTIAVVVLLLVSIQVFMEDKKLFIFESQLESAHLMARQILMDFRANSGKANNLQQLEVFKTTNFSEKFLINEKGWVLATSLNQPVNPDQKIESILSKSAIEKITDFSVNEGSFEDKNISNEASMFSFIRIPEEKMILILQAPKTSAFRASTIFILKGLVTLLGLVISSTLTSLLLSKSMTKNLSLLETSMRNFGEGQLDIQIRIQSHDEIGKLGEYFNKMVGQIKTLMQEQQEKLKLQLEMDLASELQSTFFPTQNFSSPHIDFSGFYQPSSQCGGDWWYYFTKDDYFVAFMGDVTGHGVKSALMTSASRSIFALIEEDFTDTAQAMNLLNRSFFATAMGEVNMSAIIISLNTKTGVLEYTNASHDPAMLFLPKIANHTSALPPDQSKKADYILLDEVHGKRLGTLKDTAYEKAQLEIKNGSLIFIYTDGLLEICNSSGRPFNDRMIIKACNELNIEPKTSLTHAQSDFHQKLMQFSGGLINLKDDLSYFFVKYQKQDTTQRSSHAS